MMPSRGLPALKGRVSGVRQMQLRHLSSANARRWPSQSSRHALSLSTPTSQRSGRAAVLAAPTLISARHASSWWPWTTQSAPDATFRESHPPPSTPTEAPQAPSTPVDPPPASSAAIDLPPPPASAAAQASPEATSFPNLDTITLDNFDDAPIVEHMGYLKELGLDYGFGPTSIIQWTLELIHVNSGMPWWGSIATTAIVLRMLMFPLFMRSSDQMARSMAMQSVLKPLTDRATAASRSGNQQEAMIAYQQVMAVRKRAGLSLFQQFLPMIFQTVFGYCGFKLMRAMAALPVPALVTDGPLWISDLTVSDPYLILPMIMAGSIHFLTRLGGESGGGMADTMAPGMKNVMLYVLPGFLLLCTGWLAAVVNVWFLAGGMFAVAQSVLLRRPAVRNFLGLTQFYRPTVDTTAQKEKKTVFEGVRQYLERKMGSGGAKKGEAKYSYFAPGPNNSATIDTTATIRNSSEGVAGEAGEMPPAPASAPSEYTTKNYYQAPPPEPKKMSWQAPKINTAPRTEAPRPSYVNGNVSSVSNEAQAAYKTHKAAKAGKTEMPAAAAAASAAGPAKKAPSKPSRASKGASKGGRR